MQAMKENNRKRAVGWSSFTLIVTFVCLSLVGLSLAPLLPVKLSPSHDMPGLTVSFTMPGNSARVIESEVTSRLEGMLSRVTGIRNIYSTSDNGSGYIRVELDKHADIEMTRFEVSTLIRQLWSQLPEGVSYPIISSQRSDDQAARSFMTFTLNAPATPIVIQWYGEFIGGVIGAVVAVGVMLVLVSAYGGSVFGSEMFPAAQAAAVASVVGGIANVPVFFGGLIASIIIYFITPRFTMLGLGIYLPFYLSLTACLGGFIRFVVEKAAPKFAQGSTGTVIASGLLAGEGFFGVVIALYQAATILMST